MNEKETPLMRVITMDDALNISGGHGVQAQLQSRFIRIEDETKQSPQAGETLTLQGTLVSLVEEEPIIEPIPYTN